MIASLSRLPMRALYALSGLAYLLAYYLVRHRRGVIGEQIAKVFAAAGEAERRKIHKQFLRNFCDVAVEILKSATISAGDMRARVRIVNLDAALGYLRAGQSVLLVTSHLCNWEWLLQGVALQLGYPLDVAYKPLSDPWGERLMLRIRSRFGARLVPAKQLLVDHLQRRGLVRALAMNADQAPASTERHYWTTFLGQDTAFYIGAEQIARGTRLPVIYLAMRRTARGRYAVELSQLWDGCEPTEHGEITERYARACERDVLAAPADWLWSYRRWRLQKPLYGAA
ncbi:MAG TPA: lysophospholipid acyltransferase family protein [Steroidobacteraceae bacterium]|nr:lysophospholipid acyltransferase family protein [Steroidobacteraceae bacterium]